MSINSMCFCLLGLLSLYIEKRLAYAFTVISRSVSGVHKALFPNPGVYHFASHGSVLESELGKVIDEWLDEAQWGTLLSNHFEHSLR